MARCENSILPLWDIAFFFFATGWRGNGGRTDESISRLGYAPSCPQIPVYRLVSTASIEHVEGFRGFSLETGDNLMAQAFKILMGHVQPADAIHLVQFGVFSQATDFATPDEILSGYEEDALSKRDRYTASVKEVPDATLSITWFL